MWFTYFRIESRARVWTLIQMVPDYNFNTHIWMTSQFFI